MVYTESQVLRIVKAGARIARGRAGQMTVVIKDGGLDQMSRLWRDVANGVSADLEVDCEFINVDHMCDRLLRFPHEHDVLVTTNLFGDILADEAALLLGSRGLTYSGNFSECGRAVFQTGHGEARDLAGRNLANPVGQILSLAMLLREGLGLEPPATLIEQAVTHVWRQGWRTVDLQRPGLRGVGTRQLTERIVQAIDELSERKTPYETRVAVD